MSIISVLTRRQSRGIYTCRHVQIALTAWRDYFMAEFMSPLVDASLQLVECSRGGDRVDLQLVACLVRCLGKTCAAA